MRDTYIKYRWSRIKAFIIREKTDFKKELRNLEFAAILSWVFFCVLLLTATYAVILEEDPNNYIMGGIVMFAIYSILVIYKDYKRGDDVAWERGKRKKRLYG